MAYLSPIGNEVQTDSNGNPLNGGEIFTYAAGTTTPAATYKDEGEGTAHDNPIVLNASGLPANPIWLQGGVSYKFVIKDANDNTLRTIDDITGINDPSNATTADQWVVFTGAPTYISATSFSVGGDQTGTFQVGRRVKSTNTGGTVYSTITASSYASGTGLTTVTVANDSGALDSGLSQVSYGLLSATNSSLPFAPTPTVNDSSQKIATTAFVNPARSLATSGYQKLASGLIVQWGSSAGTTDAFGVLTVALPITFPTALFSVVPSNGDGVTVAGGIVTVQSTSASSMNFKIFTGTTPWASASARVNWVAFGH